jgi:UDP-N-acetylglucosamine 4-epimerase
VFADQVDDVITKRLSAAEFTCPITAVAGFNESQLLQALLERNQVVVGLDNFTTGSLDNLDDVEEKVEPRQWRRFQLIEGDIKDMAVCERCCRGVDGVLHHAALGSIPRSVADPVATHQSNIDGFLNMLVAV